MNNKGGDASMSNVNLFTPGQPIPTPANFPLRWDNLQQARQLWILDNQHFAGQMPPLLASISHDIYAAPFNYGAARYALSVRLATLCMNGYGYIGLVPEGAPPDFVLKGINLLDRVAPGLVKSMMGKMVDGMTQKYMAQLEPVIARLDEHWANEWWPELQQHLAWWESFDLANAPLPDLLRHLAESRQHLVRAWEIHMLLIFPTFLALNLFEEFYREQIDGSDPLAAFQLLQGIDNQYQQANRALWSLSRQVQTLPAVCAQLIALPPGATIAALQELPEGQLFLTELQCYLDRFGQRGERAGGIHEISWLEDPTPVIKNMQNYLHEADRDLDVAYKLQVAAREQAVVQARERLRHQPPPVQERFERLLKAAQTATFLHEEHNFWIDQRVQYKVRRVIQEVGKRLVAVGVIDQPADIFYLTWAEILATGQPAAQPCQALVQERQAELARFRHIEPPPLLGTVPLMEPPEDLFSRTFGKVMGGSPIPKPSSTPTDNSVVRGSGGSPGVVRGRARVTRTLAEANQLQRGDILVTEATMPPWTPYFSLVAAIVTDTGGILSHAAVVAREVGIPAVVGTRVGTATIADSQMIEVDGGRGVVRILGDATN
jgi:phosphohistidine swiveling domain-containing protein